MSARLPNWHEGTPTPGRIVWVWHWRYGDSRGVGWRTMAYRGR